MALFRFFVFSNLFIAACTGLMVSQGLGFAAAGAIGPWGYVGLVPLLTGVVAHCPLYSALGIATTSR